ncbi:4-aminobutyrate--2-oxoglutarate transaminase [Aneurinibacillus aneurinilyticus]|uniref:(S)-3-amino-2-methylpropionate transaminase n=1 Tax=Aneurinibacillus aneurinilyticus ATCC 12856 TaxID=649747 RepID=U1Y164_ANEAE|nr:4-aminobutyrate--2-oxoglutarate transaminase [Aneurinibacillus aneurinilyticus]ERI05957.1 4-aminobutyrate transaminase [Aneurinibacillus aneurinilyticus ATCC 12856]MED0708531.1 4-aminobutyrate--2-oxoglutarate transaminase [Aneurinibacillus aneurinilyticus]MED0721691.1 4-aminobutyrate--2-oxoglutarate transaminase [Aneurinibacillus aneurinilyticus]MED0731815.1 4-aminobutyrate--2-oxoglutarate transaminase [Aneurinibacillus aneurinilyticus]MED0740604.1 4-aminobutyrate--2-oxoglutarate transamina
MTTNTKMMPGQKSVELHARRQDAVAVGPYHVTPLYIQSAQGAIVIDVDGNEIIDFAGGIGMQNIGHCHPKVVKAIQEQTASSIHSCFHVMPYESYIELAEKLNEKTPGDFKKKTMFANSGAEAVENAVKIARKVTGRSAVVSFERAYHGRTLMTMSLTSKVNPYKHGFGPFAPETYKLPYPYYYRAPQGMLPEELDEQILNHFEQFFLGEVSPDNIAAIIMEPVQGEGGFIVPSAEFVQGVRRICDKYGIIMIADEIQTGFARTGKLFAMENFGVAADITTLSKSIAAGMPLSAITGRAELMDVPGPGQLGGTFSGSPVACAAGLAVLDVIEEENLTERAQVIGTRMLDTFRSWQEKYDIIGDVRGLGAMVAMELVTDRMTKEPAKDATSKVVSECWSNGLIGLSAGLSSNVLRFLPPLVITDEQLDKGLHILEQAIVSASK